MLDYKKFPDFAGHEKVLEIDDAESGLSGFIAIHSTKLGPALGGTRIHNYASKEAALRDALRLSHAMTNKCAIAKLPYGGGKGVIILDPKRKNQKLLDSYAEHVKILKGKFYTGEDVGLSEADVQEMLKVCDYFIGRTGQAGDPSAYAALSVFYCIQVAMKFVYGSESLKGRTVAIKGLGKTGSELLRLVSAEGAKAIVADNNVEIIENVRAAYPDAQIVPAEEIISQQADIYAPCALGDEFNLKTAGLLKTKIICGTANNQLETPEIGTVLFEKGIVYIPDYVANAGGLINVADELEAGGYNKARVLQRIGNIKQTCALIIEESAKLKQATNFVADSLAENFIREKLISEPNVQHE